MSPQAIINTLRDQCVEKGIVIGPDPRNVDFWYDGFHYFYKENGGTYVRITERGLERQLKEKGLCELNADGRINSAPVMVYIQENNYVHYTGPIAGYPAGMHLVGDHKVLVTKGSRYIEPCEGDWTALRELIEGLFVTPEGDQTAFFYSYMHHWATGFRSSVQNQGASPVLPGQALVIAGPSGVGKTLLASCLVDGLGNSVAKPYKYMMGKTEFNGNMAGASVLLIDDEMVSRDPRDRDLFAVKTKEVVAAGPRSFRFMYREPILLNPIQRLIILSNDEPENLLLLPLQDPSMKDKIMMLKAVKHPMPVANGTLEGRRDYEAELKASLPGFMHFILNEYKIPPELQSPRFGVIEYQHPTLLKMIEDISPEGNVMEIVDELFVKGSFPVKNASSSVGTNEWAGSALEFKRIVMAEAPYWDTADLFRHKNSAGMLLSKLKSVAPHRISKSVINGTTIWRIKAPVVKA